MTVLLPTPSSAGGITVSELYARMLERYGPQGWWPLLCLEHDPETAGGDGYHPGDYSWPRTDLDRFEVAVGAVLTQNTAWRNVRTALRSLAQADMLCPHRILEADSAHLAELVRASGYFNAKARKLKALAAFWPTQDGVPPSRRELLAVWGIGPETADSILLYAFHVPELVVDTYTRRIVAAHWPAADLTGYEGLKRFCAAGLPRSVAVYQEFHALIVEHAQRHYRRNAPPDPLAHEPSAQRP